MVVYLQSWMPACSCTNFWTRTILAFMSTLTRTAPLITTTPSSVTLLTVHKTRKFGSLFFGQRYTACKTNIKIVRAMLKLSTQVIQIHTLPGVISGNPSWSSAGSVLNTVRPTFSIKGPASLSLSPTSCPQSAGRFFRTAPR